MTREEVLALRGQLSGKAAPRYRTEFGAETVQARQQEHQKRRNDRRAERRANAKDEAEAERAKHCLITREARLIKSIVENPWGRTNNREW